MKFRFEVFEGSSELKKPTKIVDSLFRGSFPVSDRVHAESHCVDRENSTRASKETILDNNDNRPTHTPEELRIAKRTAFVARFIVLREGRRTKAHRMIEEMTWSQDSDAETLANMFKAAFLMNGDKAKRFEKDLKKALDHAEYSSRYHVSHYLERACLTFSDAIADYHRTNSLLFEEDSPDRPKSGGWKAVSL